MNLWIDCERKPITELLEFIVDNRGRSVPTAEKGHILIATNCIKNDFLYPKYEKIRYLSQETYESFFRAHPLPGDIIFVNKGTPGRVCLVPDPVDFCIAQDMIALRADRNLVDNHYLLAVLRTPTIQTQIHNTYVGDVIPHFKKQFMDRLLIPLPSMNIQKKIGDIYYTLCDKIEVNRRINAELEELAQALFKFWFVDFEPFKDGEFVESELGMIPKGWKVGKAEEFYKITIGKTPPRKEQEWFTKSFEDVKWVSISDMGNCGAYIADSSEYLTNDAIQKFNIGIVPENTILLSFKLTIGRVAIAMCDLTTNEAIARFSLIDETLREYTYLMLKQYNYANLGSTSSIATAVNSKIIKQMRILMPKDEVILEFSKLMKPVFENIKKNQQEITHLTTLRDTLLPKLMSGEIDVNEVEI